MNTFKEFKEMMIQHKEELKLQYLNDYEGIIKLSKFLMDERNMTTIRHNDTDGLVCGYQLDRHSTKVIEYDYSYEGTVLDILRDEVVNGFNPKIIIVDLSIKSTQMDILYDILKYAAVSNKDIMWVDHHDSSVEAFNDDEEVTNMMSVYVTEYPIASCMQIYLGLLFLSTSLIDRSDIFNNTFEDIFPSFDYGKIIKKQFATYDFVKLASEYDTFSNITKDCVMVNDVLTVVNQVYKNDQVNVLFNFYTKLIENGIRIESLEPIMDLLKNKSVERDELYRMMVATEISEMSDYYLLHLGHLNYNQSRLSSVVSNIYLNKYHSDFNKPLVISWVYLADSGDKKLSFRSLDDTAYKIASIHGGGGHLRAAGCEYSKQILFKILGKVYE